MVHVGPSSDQEIEHLVKEDRWAPRMALRQGGGLDGVRRASIRIGCVWKKQDTGRCHGWGMNELPKSQEKDAHESSQELQIRE